MINRILGLMRQVSSAQSMEPAEQMRLCVAALLVEVARADHTESAVENASILGLIRRSFNMDDAAAGQLLADARAAVESAVSLRDFTKVLHERLSYEDKQRLIAMLWRVAFDDKTLDKYEDYLVGKLAELLYVSRGDVIRLRYQAQQAEIPRDDRENGG